LTVRSIGNILKSKVKRNFRLFVFVVVLFLAGCFSTKPCIQLDKSLIGEVLGPYSGKKAKIAVSDFELKTSGANAQAGLALKDAFISILNNSQRFLIVSLSDADLIINVNINEFVPESSGGKFGIGGGGSGQSNFMGGLLSPTLSKSNMQLGLRIIDHANSSVISSRDIYSQVSQIPGHKIKIPRVMVFKAGLSMYADTPMGKVIYDCLLEATRYIAQNVPLNYYKN